MFVRRKEFEQLKYNVERLSKNLGKLNQEMAARGTVLERHGSEINNLERIVGVNNSYINFWSMSYGTQEDRKFNLLEKVDAILEHLGLAESATLENKLIPAPKERVEKK